MPALTKPAVHAVLTSNGFHPCSRFRKGFTIEEGSGSFLVFAASANSKALLTQPERCEMLMRMRQALLPHYGVELHGSHHSDGYPVCLILSERLTATESTSAYVEIEADATLTRR